MADPDRGLSVAEVAAMLKIGRSTVRQLFDDSYGAAGERVGPYRERRFHPAWVAAEADRRASRQPRSVATELSVAEVAERLDVGKNTVRRWFDRDQPASGRLIEGGRTGGTERACAEAWVAGLEVALARRESPPG